MRILVIDNIDSFVYNLVQYIGELNGNPYVIQKTMDEKKVDELIGEFDGVVISPGPGKPVDAGISNYILNKYDDTLPILGVCLGHQCIGERYGAKVTYATNLMHGKTSEISHKGKGIFKNIPNPFIATRYHSLMVDEKTLPDCLKVSARSDDDGEVMGLTHAKKNVFGVQFHPESILTKHGLTIIKNFLEVCK